MDKKKFGLWVFVIVLLFVVFVIGIPLGINACYQCDTVLITTQWGAEDVLSYYGAILGSFVTMAGLVTTIRFTMRQIRRDSYLKSESDKWAKTEAVVSNILNEINPMLILNQVMDTGFTDSKKATNSLYKYQISCRTATDQLSAYLNTIDYPRVKELIDKIADVADKCFQISQKITDQYRKQRELERRKIALELLSIEEKHPGSLPAEEIAKHRLTVQTTDSIRSEDIENAIQELHVEFIRIYEADFRGLLQLKGATFEMISVQTRENADSILSLRRKQPCPHLNGSEKTR